MGMIKLDTLALLKFDKTNQVHKDYLKELINDESITSRFCGLLPMLMSSSKDIFERGYFVMDEDEFIGYIDIGAYNHQERSVYLRGAIVKQARGMGYGKKMLSEVTDHMLENYDNVDYVKLKSATDNTSAINTIESCGFVEIFDGLYYMKRTYENVSHANYKY